ncbi:MAG: M20/M25/M40 family metallo-hydrolase [Peptococcaceae bacterium]|nr:M20/M25/M40 family metallo-hydrolase [Peptococcaceae bacterium]
MLVNITDEFLKLISIDSPSKNERDLAIYLKSKLKDLGAEVYEDNSAGKTGSNTGNIIGFISGNQNLNTILLAAHMDTIVSTDGMVPQIKNGIIYSDGNTILGADDKAGIAVIIGVLSKLQKDKTIQHGPIEVFFTVQEEVGLIGVKNLEYEIKAQYGYVLDGDGPVGTIVNAAPSHVTLDLIVEGKAAHAGVAPEKGINAIVVASKAIANLDSGRLDEETTSNFGIISGGKGRNIVADKVEIKAEVRSRNRNKLEKEVSKIIEEFTKTAANHHAKFTYHRELAYEAFTIDQEHPVITGAFEAGKTLGIEVKLKTTGGGLDANILNSRGVPCVALGLGNDNPHTNDEYVSINEMQKAVEFLFKILTNKP